LKNKGKDSGKGSLINSGSTSPKKINSGTSTPLRLNSEATTPKNIKSKRPDTFFKHMLIEMQVLNLTSMLRENSNQSTMYCFFAIEPLLNSKPIYNY
jgi:hypothetical protein